VEEIERRGRFRGWRSKRSVFFQLWHLTDVILHQHGEAEIYCHSEDNEESSGKNYVTR